jgi:hypothetical protein
MSCSCSCSRSFVCCSYSLVCMWWCNIYYTDIITNNIIINSKWIRTMCTRNIILWWRIRMSQRSLVRATHSHTHTHTHTASLADIWLWLSVMVNDMVNDMIWYRWTQSPGVTIGTLHVRVRAEADEQVIRRWYPHARLHLVHHHHHHHHHLHVYMYMYMCITIQ